jgi:hypothetical protein
VNCLGVGFLPRGARQGMLHNEQMLCLRFISSEWGQLMGSFDSERGHFRGLIWLKMGSVDGLVCFRIWSVGLFVVIY